MELVGDSERLGGEDVGDEDGGESGKSGDGGAESRDVATHGDAEATDDSGVSDVGHVSGRKFNDSEETGSLSGGDDFVFDGGGAGRDDENGDGEVVAHGEARGELQRGEEMAHSRARNKSDMRLGFHGELKKVKTVSAETNRLWLRLRSLMNMNIYRIYKFFIYLFIYL